MAVDVFDIARGIEPACDPGLVGHNRHRHFGPVQSGNCLRGTVDELDSVNRPDIAVVDDDGSVPVEQDAGARNGVPLLSSAPSTRGGGFRVLTRLESRAD